MWISLFLIVVFLVVVIQGDDAVDRYRRLGGDNSHYCCEVDMPMTFLTRSRTKVEYKQVRSVVKTGSEPCGFHQVCATYEQIYRKEPTYVAEYYHVPKQDPCPNNKISCCPGYVMRAGHCLSGDDLIKENQTINDLKRLGLGPFVGQPTDENAKQGDTAAPKKTTSEVPVKQTTKEPQKMSTEGPTVLITDAPTIVVTKAPTTEVTEAPKVTTETVTGTVTTQTPTTAQAEKVTEAVTETATEAPTKAPTTKVPEPQTEAPTEKSGDANEEMSANDADELLALLRKLELIEKATEEPVVQPSGVPKTYEAENEKVTTAEPEKTTVKETEEDEIKIAEEGEDEKMELDEDMLLKILERLEAKERAAQN